MRLERDQQVLIFAPVGRDGPASAELLRSAKMETILCESLSELVTELGAGAAAVFLAEEGLFGQELTSLKEWIGRQPAWSDLPFVVLTSHREHPAMVAWRRDVVGALRNV